MADINRAELEALSTRRADQPSAAIGGPDKGPSLKVLQDARRALPPYFGAEEVVGKFNPDRITMRQMEQMRRDPMLRLGLHFRKVPLVRAPWRVDCPDPQIAAFVEGCLRRIWNELISGMLTALDFGRSCMVKQFGRDAPDWEYEDPATRELKPVWPDSDIPAVVLEPPHCLHPRGAEVEFGSGGNTFDGFTHHGLSKKENDSKPLRVPASHALWYVNEREESFGDWYGYPATGYAFRYWWSYWYRWLLGDRHFEQDADPPLIVDYPPGTSPNPDDDTALVANVDVAIAAGQALRSGSTVALSSDVYASDVDGRPTGTRKWDARFLKGGENMGAFQDSFEYLDIMKLRAVLVPEQALVEGVQGSGSRNVAEAHGDALVESQAITLASLVRHVNDYVVPDLIAQNFVTPPEARVITEGLRPQDAEMTSELLRILASNDPKALQVNIRKLAEQAGLPLLTPDEIEKAKEEALAEAERQRRIFEETRGGGLPQGNTPLQGKPGPQGKGPQGERKQGDARDGGKPPPSNVTSR
jgi:hypothetical protein